MRYILFTLLAFNCLFVSAQTENDKNEITKKNNTVKLIELENKFKFDYQLNKKNIQDFTNKSKIPFRITNDSCYMEIEKIGRNGKPIYLQSHNLYAAKATRVNYLQDSGGLGLNLTGQNMIVYVWDSGHPRITHDEYKDASNISRVSLEDVIQEGGNYTQYHATHVTGTIVGSGKALREAKGMASKAISKNYKWTDHFSEVTNVAANGALVSNHSYGWYNNGLDSYEFGNYSSTAADWDAIMFNAPYFLMVFSAGNDGLATFNSQPLLNGFDKISGHQCAKNNLVVANAANVELDELGNYIVATINASSSQGPMDELRIKPDIAGKGTNVLSAYSTNDYSCATLTGTSMATPNISGSLLLIQQHHKNETGSFLKAASLKGLVLHTADDILPIGPDAFSGWGLLNAKKAVQTISSNGKKSSIQELTLQQGQTYSLLVNSDEINSLIASISWTDLPGNASTVLNSNQSKLINDLDIRITKNGSTFYPYKLVTPNSNGTGDNQVDPFEKTIIENPSGSYLITVSHKGNLVTGQQNFTLIVTGIVQNCSVQVPTDLSSSFITENSAVLKWKNSEDTFYRVQYRIVGSANWISVITSEKELKLIGLSPFSNYEVRIESYCDTTTSGYSSLTYFSTTGNYCSSVGSYYRNIRNVQLNSFNNNTLINNAEYYSFFDESIKLVKGQTNNVQITTANYSFGLSIWIDYNQNGSFNDAGELVFSSPNASVNPITGTFIVPTSVPNAVTRMRISIKQNGIPTSCENGFSGQVQDYLVKISDTECENTTIWDGLSWNNGLPNSNSQVIFNGNYSGSGFECCTLTINPNHTVTILENQNVIVDGLISIPSNASFVLQNATNLIQNKNIGNTGNIKIYRDTSPLKRLDYVLWSSPVSSQNLFDFSPNTLTNRFYTYNSTSNLYQSVDPLTTNFQVASSNLIRLPNNHPQTPTIWTGVFEGIPNNGDYTLSLPINNFVAVGNPYPSSFNLYDFAIENTMQTPIYFWRKENNANSSSYATYTLFLGGISNSGDPNQIEPQNDIMIGQGFIIYNRFPTLKFKNYMRTKNNLNSLLRQNINYHLSNNSVENIEKHKILLSLSNSEVTLSNMMLAYVEGGTDGIDAFIDGAYLNDSQNALTSLIEDEEFTIQGRGLPFNVNDEISLSFKTTTTDTFSISMNSGTGIFNQSQLVYLEDSFTNNLHNLSLSPYQFISGNGVFTNRFKIKFSPIQLSINENELAELQVYINNNQLYMYSLNEKIYEVSIFDSKGSLLYKDKNLNDNIISIDFNSFSKGVYILKVGSENGLILTKKIIYN